MKCIHPILPLFLLTIVACQKASEPPISQVPVELPNEVVFAPDRGQSATISRRTVRGASAFVPAGPGVGGGVFTPSAISESVEDTFGYVLAHGGIHTLPQTIRTNLETRFQSSYLPASGPYSPFGALSPFGSQKSSFFLPPFYGSSFSIDALLADADHLRWKKPRTQNVLRMKLGQRPQSNRPNACWEFTISSDHPVHIRRSMVPQPFPTFNNNIVAQPESVQFTQEGERQIRVSGLTQVGRRSAGLVFSIEAEKGCSRVQPFFRKFIQSSFDPWMMGFLGMFNQSFFFYPPNPESCAREDASIRLQGYVSDCPQGEFTVPTLVTIDEELSHVLRRGGMSPFFGKFYDPTDAFISIRSVNYGGMDWLR